jgi:hypothetical protein
MPLSRLERNRHSVLADSGLQLVVGVVWSVFAGTPSRVDIACWGGTALSLALRSCLVAGRVWTKLRVVRWRADTGSPQHTAGAILTLR